MFCPNCGNKLNGTEEFCSNCGTSINSKNEINNIPNLTMSEKMSKNSQAFLTPIINKIKTFISKYKKQLTIVCSCILVIVMGFILFNKFYDFTKISWIEDYGDYKLEYTSGKIIELKAEAFDKEEKEITELDYKSDDGSVEVKDNVAYWTLPNKEGIYEIYAIAPSGKKIKHEIKVVKIEDDSTNAIGGLIQEEIDDNTADSDNDGIVNAKEKELGTDPFLADTDRDGLLDSYEIDQSKTDPLKEDSDNDSLNDGNELDVELDPLKEDSKGDGIKDGERTISYNVEKTDLGISIEINGKGNITSTTIDVFENSTFTDMDGVLDEVYNFYTDGTIESAIVKIKYNLSDLEAKGLNEDNLTFYYFNDDNKKLEAMPTIVDKENKILTITLEHFSKYIIGDKNLVITDNKTQIMAVIDNSVSMYTYDQLSNAGYYDIVGADGNDSEFKRLSLTNNLVDMFTGNYEFGVAEFSGNYVNLKDFTSDKDNIKKAVNGMNTNFQSNTNGTNIVTALKSGIDEFSNDENNHYIILLTDGKDTTETLTSNKETIISNAKEKEVKICVIGLGNETDSEDLNEIAESTGCDYYHASDAEALDEIYSLVGSGINYNQVDTDGDGKTDGTIIADSGFITSRDGIRYHNPATIKQSTNGLCYGIATFARLRYRNELPTSLGEKTTKGFYLFDGGFVEFYSSGYDLNNTYFTSDNNLYDYVMTDDVIRTRVFEFPSDIRDRVEDGIYYVNDKYYDMFKKIGITYELKKYKGDIKGIKKYQSVGYLDLENDKFETNGNNEDVQFLKAIWRLFILQNDDKTIGFGGSPDKAYNSLLKELNNKNPIVLGIGGNHAVNAVRLIQDNEDSNNFKLEIYDNNYPGEKRYIEITRSKLNKFTLDYTAWTNEYEYSFEYEDYENSIDVNLFYPEIN